ncbi:MULTISPECIES: flagellar biosynthetic protein FliO [Dickeya]|uniref:flagellar biosynthetic protein FliO n=1 Tax=Dickeya TaxID=204037 RepID=UPI001AECE795|nr:MULTISPECIES: flagellar biosynthetic protein FliO [Dickeya]MBP2835898.1 flagellar biosynthetic protein FliO [Dickeya parazeae]UCZ74726.1 flagellar biosynthetic protein FliO [Dickeya zeae]
MAGTAQQITSTIQQPPVAAESVISGGALLSQVGTALCGVLLLILLVAWALRKLGFAPQTKNSNIMKMVSAYPVGQRERIVIVEVDDTWLVLGVTAQQITHLHTLPARPINDAASAESIAPTDFLQFLKKATKRPEKTE